jgi:2-furoyl-CoA dehydrogenase 2Fe-2S iron sulfur subunit
MPRLNAGERHPIRLTVNGRAASGWAEPRLLLADFLRWELGLSGTHVGCEHGICGACTVRLDGAAVRSCLILAVQADGRHIETVEGLAAPDGPLSPLQAAFGRNHALQCGFCTPGILMSASAWLERHSDPSEQEVRAMLSGHLCRCTGYTNIVCAVLEAAAELRRLQPVAPDAGPGAGKGRDHLR